MLISRTSDTPFKVPYRKISSQLYFSRYNYKHDTEGIDMAQKELTWYWRNWHALKELIWHWKNWHGIEGIDMILKELTCTKGIDLAKKELAWYEGIGIVFFTETLYNWPWDSNYPTTRELEVTHSIKNGYIYICISVSHRVTLCCCHRINAYLCIFNSYQSTASQRFERRWMFLDTHLTMTSLLQPTRDSLELRFKKRYQRFP